MELTVVPSPTFHGRVTICMEEAAEDWLEDAAEELETAKYLYKGGRVKPAAFHLHQSAEKALKALSIHHTGSYPRTHDLVKLHRESDAPEDYYETLRYLNPASTAARYPDTATFEVSHLDDRFGELSELIAWIRKR